MLFGETARLKRRSLCECLFPWVHDDVPDGKLYQIDTTLITKGQYVCGGCGQIIQARMVAVVSIGTPAGLMPLEILEILNDGKTPPS